jgi:hypothetical protein
MMHVDCVGYAILINVLGAEYFVGHNNLTHPPSSERDCR